MYSVIDKPPTFDTPVLISALRISSTYDYPDLRAFSLSSLEDASLSAIARIQLAREFNLSPWEDLAYEELCNREEAITREEARVLGTDMVSDIARAREKKRNDTAKRARKGPTLDDFSNWYSDLDAQKDKNGRNTWYS